MGHPSKGLERLNEPLPGAPPQFRTDEKCTECGRYLSRYNPYVVCGPCRHRLSLQMPPEVVEEEDDSRVDVTERTFVWERFEKRKPVRREAA